MEQKRGGEHQLPVFGFLIREQDDMLMYRENAGLWFSRRARRRGNSGSLVGDFGPEVGNDEDRVMEWEEIMKVYIPSDRKPSH
jgi:hypothetical protein